MGCFSFHMISVFWFFVFYLSEPPSEKPHTGLTFRPHLISFFPFFFFLYYDFFWAPDVPKITTSIFFALPAWTIKPTPHPPLPFPRSAPCPVALLPKKRSFSPDAHAISLSSLSSCLFFGSSTPLGRDLLSPPLPHPPPADPPSDAFPLNRAPRPPGCLFPTPHPRDFPPLSVTLLGFFPPLGLVFGA